MATFSYNIFKNPNNDGIYYSDHSHDLNTGMTIANNYGHNTNVTHFRSPNTVHPHLHRKWLIDESNSTSNGPIFRNHNGNTLFINSTLAQQPIARPFDYTPSINTEDETGGSGQTNSAGDYTTATSYSRVAEDSSTFSQQSAAQAQAAATIAQESDTTASKINPKNIVDGMNTYLDLDQGLTEGNSGEKTMSLMPLMSQGTGAISGSASQFTSESARLEALGIKETSLGGVTGTTRHYFPVRGRVINGYNSTSTNAPTFPNTTNTNNYARQRVSLMNFNIQRSSHSSYLH
jgi:hypothetical protein